jgi:hypothetical protein
MPQVFADTAYFVVTKEGTTMMNLRGIANAVKGGMDLDEVEIFTDEDSARLARVANHRRAQVEQFCSGHILEASSLVLFDRDGVVLDKVTFMPVEHTPVE